MSKRILFQLNLAKMRAPFDDPVWEDFKAKLSTVHELAEQHPGFVWRYQGEKDDDGYIKPYPNAPLIMGNMSAWRDYSSLFEFTFRDVEHLAVMRTKRKWFERIPTPYNVLYYGSEDDLDRPDVELLEIAKRRLSYLSVYGETPVAFGFGSHGGVL